MVDWLGDDGKYHKEHGTSCRNALQREQIVKTQRGHQHSDKHCNEDISAEDIQWVADTLQNQETDDNENQRAGRGNIRLLHTKGVTEDDQSADNDKVCQSCR